LLAEEFDPVGPAVIVGAPGERLARLGASREYLATWEWREAVTRLIEEAALIVVIIGDTENLFWELRTAPATVAGHSMKILAMNGWHEDLKGAPSEGSVIIDFPRVEAAKAWYDSSLYREHWDVIQDEATEQQSKSGNPMFGDGFPTYQ
jgi:uncharacterized protein (DUF1330 family)